MRLLKTRYFNYLSGSEYFILVINKWKPRFNADYSSLNIIEIIDHCSGTDYKPAFILQEK